MLASYKLSGKYIFISGFLFTSVLGTLSHFFYEWSGDSTFIGLVCPDQRICMGTYETFVLSGSALLLSFQTNI